MLGEWYLPPGKCQAISTITEGIISISHPAPLSSQTRIPQTSSPLVDKSQATQAALLQIRRSEPVSGRCLPGSLLRLFDADEHSLLDSPTRGGDQIVEVERVTVRPTLAESGPWVQEKHPVLAFPSRLL